MTYSELKASIITTLNRSDLTSEVDSQIRECILALQRDYFYISAVREVIVLVQGQVFYDVPADMLDIDFVRLDYANTWQFMREVEYRDILIWDANIPSTQSPPVCWAPFDGMIRIYPAPDQVYDLELTGNQKVPIPATDSTDNFWTSPAGPMVKYLVLAQIYQTRINDPNRAAQCAQTAELHRTSLKNETVMRATNSRVYPNWY